MKDKYCWFFLYLSESAVHNLKDEERANEEIKNHLSQQLKVADLVGAHFEPLENLFSLQLYGEAEAELDALRQSSKYLSDGTGRLAVPNESRTDVLMRLLAPLVKEAPVAVFEMSNVCSPTLLANATGSIVKERLDGVDTIRFVANYEGTKRVAFPIHSWAASQSVVA